MRLRKQSEMTGRRTTMRVKIELEFDHDDVDNAEVYNYLNELMENEFLSWEIEDE